MKQTTSRIRKVFRDPVTGEKSHVWADKITCRYDDIEKGPIIMEFLKGELSAEEMVEKYHICSVQTLYAWVGKFLTQEESVSFLYEKIKIIPVFMAHLFICGDYGHVGFNRSFTDSQPLNLISIIFLFRLYFLTLAS